MRSHSKIFTLAVVSLLPFGVAAQSTHPTIQQALRHANTSLARSYASSVAVKGFPPPLPPADLVLRDAVVATLIPGRPHAQAIAIRDGRIEALGSDAGIAHYIGPATKVIDLHGAFVTPGFIDGHAHLMQTGQSLMRVNVGKAANWQGILKMIQARVAKSKPGQWIVGYGWLQNKWNKLPKPNYKGLPLQASLDAVSPHNPVMLITAAFHGVYANAMAFKLAGITTATANPQGGTIVRDHGRIVGMLRDTAADPVHAAFARYLKGLPPAQKATRREKAFRLAVQHEISQGITTVVDMSSAFGQIRFFRQQARKGRLPMRIYANISVDSMPYLEKHVNDFHQSYDHDHIIVGGLGEDVSDGALGTRSAWFLEPYSDDPGNHGKNVTPMRVEAALAKFAAAHRLQLSIHAIGDRANHELLDLYQKIFSLDPSARTLRWRIEHAQHLNPVDIPRFAKLGVIASMQSIHACSDAPMVVARIGHKRAQEGAYVWHKLIQSGAMVLDGTDTPVEDTNPIPNFYCAVTRVTHYSNGAQKAFFPQEAKTRMQELRDYTWNNAYAIFQEHHLGSLAPGKFADIDVFSGNLLTMPARDILRTRVLYTIVAGKVVYKRPGAGKWRNGQRFKPMPEFDHVE
ncbi:MAG TPA: amidohydrolase [Rhodanobacteraceae bacterium]